MGIRQGLGRMAHAERYVVVSGSMAGFVGAIAGLIIGLRVHPATAWFAMFEVGVPAALAGGLIGLVAAGVSVGLRRHQH